jgi:hypothetical protein
MDTAGGPKSLSELLRKGRHRGQTTDRADARRRQMGRERPRVDGGIEAAEVSVAKTPFLGALLAVGTALVQQIDLGRGERDLGKASARELVQRVTRQTMPAPSALMPFLKSRSRRLIREGSETSNGNAIWAMTAIPSTAPVTAAIMLRRS